MKSFIATALLFCSQSDATLEETSLMQGLVQRHNQLSGSSTNGARNDATAKLMETATKMMKSGATPDVITFIETTITEVNQNVLGAIVDEHQRDQALIDELLARFDRAVAAMEAACAEIAQKHTDRMEASMQHKQCRSLEALDCARSRRCEEELEHLWIIVRNEETEMRRIHWAIHGEWCLGSAPDHPSLADPFHWTVTEYKEGAETSESINDYPQVDLEDDVIEFRRFSVDYFGQYIVQKPRVEVAWANYNRKLLECAHLEEVWNAKVETCDDLQDIVHDQACEHASHHRQSASNFGHEYHMTMVAYNEAVTAIRQLEYDRKREWETLHITTCLLQTVYTHVIHSIDSGEPCPTTESHPEQTEAEINYCHVVEESLTTNLTIDYGIPPEYDPCPIDDPGPCTAQYIWDEHGSFPLDTRTSHSDALAADEGLENYMTTLSFHGWAGCAAPKACIPCEVEELVIDPAYTSNDVCKAHQEYLRPGQIDFDTFKCQSGDQCILSSGRCNGQSNCDDGSDEVGCDTTWGLPAVLQNDECQESFISDVQFRCADNTCTPIEGRCNGVSNCADGSDEQGCSSGITGLTIEATTGYTASIEIPTLHSEVFYDRQYTFDSLGSFSGHSYIKMSNEDKHIRHSHVQMKLRLPQPSTVYIVKLNDHELPWLYSDGWTLSNLEGVSYHGVRSTRHTDWSGDLTEDFFGPGEVWQKTYPAGTVELRGNDGGDGSYLMFAANPSSAPEPPLTTTNHPTVVSRPIDLAPPAWGTLNGIPAWGKMNENWNCGENYVSQDATSGVACAQACDAVGHDIAGFWNANQYNSQILCRCYDECNDGGSTNLPQRPNTVMQKFYQVPSGWNTISENWNCGDGDSSPVGNSNAQCAEACGAEGYGIAAFWPSNMHNSIIICRCYNDCSGGHTTNLPQRPNLVMQKVN